MCDIWQDLVSKVHFQIYGHIVVIGMNPKIAPLIHLSFIFPIFEKFSQIHLISYTHGMMWEIKSGAMAVCC